jgi:hypothetical protein
LAQAPWLSGDDQPAGCPEPEVKEDSLFPELQADSKASAMSRMTAPEVERGVHMDEGPFSTAGIVWVARC